MRKSKFPSVFKAVFYRRKLLQLGLFIAGFFFFALFYSCTRMPDIQGKGEALLQGIWVQDSIQHREKLLNYTQHQFKFTCDSFYVDFTTVSKANYYEEACFNNGIWKEYAKGTYEVRNDTLFLKGVFTKSNYKQKVSGCYRNGQYISNFILRQIQPKLLVLESLNDQKEINLQMKQSLICVPKPI